MGSKRTRLKHDMFRETVAYQFWMRLVRGGFNYDELEPLLHVPDELLPQGRIEHALRGAPTDLSQYVDDPIRFYEKVDNAIATVMLVTSVDDPKGLEETNAFFTRLEHAIVHRYGIPGFRQLGDDAEESFRI